jgi:hypothetical protein
VVVANGITAFVEYRSVDVALVNTALVAVKLVINASATFSRLAKKLVEVELSKNALVAYRLVDVLSSITPVLAYNRLEELLVI